MSKKIFYSLKNINFAARSMVNKFGLVIIVLVIISFITFKPQQKVYINQDVELPNLEEETITSVPQDENEWITVTTQPNDTLLKIFNKLKLSSQLLHNIL